MHQIKQEWQVCRLISSEAAETCADMISDVGTQPLALFLHAHMAKCHQPLL